MPGSAKPAYGSKKVRPPRGTKRRGKPLNPLLLGIAGLSIPGAATTAAIRASSGPKRKKR